MRRRFLPMWLLFPGVLLSLGAQALFAQAASPAPQSSAAAPAAQSPDAQDDGSAAQTQSSTPQLKTSPLKALENFEPAEDAEYELGPGDQIMIDVPGRPELSGSKIVGPDGRITVPVIGPVKVADKTREQVSQMLVANLSPYYQNLTVTVSIERYGSNRIIVIGNVEHPGVYYFDTTPTLLDAIARGGLLANNSPLGGTGNPGGTARDGIPDRVAIYRGNDQVVWVQLREMLQSGSSLADMRLKRGDIVFVPSQQEIFVSVLGAVGHPGAVPLTPQSTVVSVLAQAGGMAEGAGRNVEVIQPSTGKTITISYKSLMTPQGSNEVTLHSGDVIYVQQSGMYRATYVLQRISPLATLGTIAAIAVAP